MLLSSVDSSYINITNAAGVFLLFPLIFHLGFQTAFKILFCETQRHLFS